MSHFESYLHNIESVNLHPKINKLIQKLPEKLSDLNIIIFGPPNTGKYSRALHIISKYSPSKLKYEKKVNVINDSKEDHFCLKMSDIHFEIDMFLLGCNSKNLWFAIYQHIIDIVSLKKTKDGIILCKNFHLIHNELLDVFYSYMQKNFLNVNIHFILLTEEVSFIPNNIVKCCNIIHIPKPYNTNIVKCGKKDNIVNYDGIIDSIIKKQDFISLRTSLYNIFIYQLNIYSCLWLICKKLNKKNVNEMFYYFLTFFHGYNNNYRHIFHIELLIHSLSTIE